MFYWHCLFKGLCKKFYEMAVDSRESRVMSDSGQYDTPRGDWLCELQYDTPGRLTLRSMIPREDFYEKLRLTRRNLSKIENILTHWSVAQAGSNDEKNGVEIITGLSL